MRKLLRIPSNGILSLLILFSCNASADKNLITVTDTDTALVKASPEPPPQQIILKDVFLTEKDLIANKRILRSHKLTPDEFMALSIKAIDSTAGDENNFTYHLVDTIFAGAGIKAMLLAREYESENIAWFAIYNDQGKLLDHRQVYYDNAEGFLLVESIIKNNELSVTTQNDFEGEGTKTTVHYKLDKDHRIVKAK